MKLLLTILVALASACPAKEWIITKGGVSPDERFAVAVHPKSQSGIDYSDGTVLLIDHRGKNEIGPLEEVDSTGGMHGDPETNVRCEWLADSRLLLVNFRVGRLRHTHQIYRFNGRRAIPLSLPDGNSHPKGKILEALTTSVNAGSTIRFSERGEIVVRRYGYMPKEGHLDEDYSEYGLKDFEGIGGVLLFVHRLQKDGSLKLVDIMAEPEAGN